MECVVKLKNQMIITFQTTVLEKNIHSH